MIQTTLSVPLEVKPESVERLSSLIRDFKLEEDRPNGLLENFARLTEKIPTLHFMSLSVFEDSSYDPIFVIEVNFDGPPDPLWAQIDTLARETFRDMLRCCKKPLDEDGPLYTAITKPKSRDSVAPYLKARTQRPSVYHHGNRGLPKDQILKEAKLFRAIRSELDAPENQGPEPYRGASPKEIHKRLRAKQKEQFDWLDQPAPVRITTMQKIGDFLRLLLYISAVLLAFTLPGIIAATILPPKIYLAIIGLCAAVFVIGSFLLRKPLENTDVKTEFSIVKYVPIILLVLLAPVLVLILFGTAFVTAAIAVLGVFFTEISGGFSVWWWPVAKTIVLGQLSLVFTIPGIILWLRFLERRDSSQISPPIDEDKVTDMLDHEDWVSQNHMGSIVNIRPGVLRTIIVRTGHLGLGLLLRIQARDGYLGSMRTVHYAHWAFLNNGSRLLFVSNFDQSWGSYLDDFIEKAHAGLTLAWGCGVGFPPTRFLLFDGASHGRLFKNWALASRTTSRFWYSAYPDLSVDQIERNHSVANGLRAESLSDEETTSWLRKL